MIKAVSFDVGHTLIKYNNPLNWSSLYKSALGEAIRCCNMVYSDKKIEEASLILTKYNTRINYREIEFTSDVIFGEILNIWNEDLTFLNKVKEVFFSFFQADALPYTEVEDVLLKLKSNNFKVGVLTDVAYGMDNKFSFKDICIISEYIDVAITSVDVGFRKPNREGFQMLLTAFDIRPFEMLYVGDEEKDIIGANKIGIGSVLINRSNKEVDYGQDYTLNSLNEIMDIISRN